MVFKKIIIFYRISNMNLAPFNATGNNNESIMTEPVETNLKSGETIEQQRAFQSSQPGNYKLTENAYIQSQGQGFVKSLSDIVDIESEFRNLGVLNTKVYDPETDPYQKYQKRKQASQIEIPRMNPNHTKSHRSTDNISFIQVNRFDYQTVPVEIYSNSNIGSNTRLDIKDRIKNL